MFCRATMPRVSQFTDATPGGFQAALILSQRQPPDNDLLGQQSQPELKSRRRLDNAKNSNQLNGNFYLRAGSGS